MNKKNINSIFGELNAVDIAKTTNEKKVIIKEFKSGKNKLTRLLGKKHIGKTTMLIELYKKSNNGIIYKPRADIRYSKSKLSTYDLKEIDACLIDSLQDINVDELKRKGIKEIFIDELQFFRREDFEYIKFLLNKGFDVITTGITVKESVSLICMDYYMENGKHVKVDELEQILYTRFKHIFYLWE